MRARLAKAAAALALWAGALAALHGWQTHQVVTEYLSVPPAATARALGSGFDNLLADGLYLQFIVYFGKHLSRDRQYHNVEPELSLLTDLDPRFEAAYVLGSLALGDNGHVDAAEHLLAKGVEKNPGDWHFAYDAGMNLYLFTDRPEVYMRAARYFKLAASHPDAPPVATYMYARMFDVAHRDEVAKRIWLETYRHGSREERLVAIKALARWHVKLPSES